MMTLEVFPFAQVKTAPLCMQAMKKALASLCICAGLYEPTGLFVVITDRQQCSFQQSYKKTG